MTDETKLIFAGPWKASQWCVLDSNDRVVATCASKKDAVRIAMLPDLYEALDEALHIICNDCQKKLNFTSRDCKYCHRQSWRDILDRCKGGV